ncbi:hypothetical protein [Catellatospora coxensis]|uniref:Uncharacterized protein n=1 Tax=Catellatospora coxensis TaxID=310354 RepID=A0A8J3L3V7_9ACTN|nr:hypothetical protein [Catellatospora coxensis]GIG11602.1 hypothetical protein Cco03nite_83020 [Catellatospora coxensis]
MSAERRDPGEPNGQRQEPDRVPPNESNLLERWMSLRPGLTTGINFLPEGSDLRQRAEVVLFAVDTGVIVAWIIKRR